MSRQSITKNQVPDNLTLFPLSNKLRRKTTNRRSLATPAIDRRNHQESQTNVSPNLFGVAPSLHQHFSQAPVRTNTPYPIQAKLKIGQPNDKYEQEADRVADQVMRMPDPRPSSLVGSPLSNSASSYGGAIQRSCASCSGEYKTAREENRFVQSSNLCPKCRTQGQDDGSYSRSQISICCPQRRPPRGLTPVLDEQESARAAPSVKLDEEQPYNGGSATIVCDGSGGYGVDLGGWAGAACGIEGCVTRHEQSHAQDWAGRWPNGCKNSDGTNKPAGSQIPLGGAGYAAFLKQSECDAYTVEEACIAPLLTAATGGCRATLRAHQTDTQNQKTSFCS